MKSQLVTALSVVGVIGTASAAFAANTETLASFDSTPAEAVTTQLGDQTAVVSDRPLEATPAPSTSSDPAQPGTPSNQVVVNSDTLPAYAPDTAVDPAPAPAPADGTTAGSGSRVDPVEEPHDDDDHEDYDDDDHEEEDDD